MLGNKYGPYTVITLIVGGCIAISMLIAGAYELYNFEYLAKQVEVSGAFKSLGFQSTEQWEGEHKRGIYLKLFVGIGLLVFVALMRARVKGSRGSRGQST
jgi:hypothetical protein